MIAWFLGYTGITLECLVTVSNVTRKSLKSKLWRFFFRLKKMKRCEWHGSFYIWPYFWVSLNVFLLSNIDPMQQLVAWSNFSKHFWWEGIVIFIHIYKVTSWRKSLHWVLVALAWKFALSKISTRSFHFWKLSH